jgi:hypothetical protein
MSRRAVLLVARRVLVGRPEQTRALIPSRTRSAPAAVEGTPGSVLRIPNVPTETQRFSNIALARWLVPASRSVLTAGTAASNPSTGGVHEPNHQAVPRRAHPRRTRRYEPIDGGTGPGDEDLDGRRRETSTHRSEPANGAVPSPFDKFRRKGALVNIKRVAAAVAIAVAASVAVQSPAMAANGPEGVPIVQGAYFPDAYINGVHTPLSKAYQWLDQGKLWSFGNVYLQLRSGNLELHRQSNDATVWHTSTLGSGATQLLFQRDGNLVLYTAGYKKAVWSSRTQNGCLSPDQPILSLQGDSNMVIYCARELNLGDAIAWAVRLPAIWSTGTSGV